MYELHTLIALMYELLNIPHLFQIPSVLYHTLSYSPVCEGENSDHSISLLRHVAIDRAKLCPNDMC